MQERLSILLPLCVSRLLQVPDHLGYYISFPLKLLVIFFFALIKIVNETAMRGDVKAIKERETDRRALTVLGANQTHHCQI
jgi:hypothetical protein